MQDNTSYKTIFDKGEQGLPSRSHRPKKTLIIRLNKNTLLLLYAATDADFLIDSSSGSCAM